MLRYKSDASETDFCDLLDELFNWVYLLSSLASLFVTGADRNSIISIIVFWVTIIVFWVTIYYSVLGYACLCPRVYDSTLRLRPGDKKRPEGAN